MGYTTEFAGKFTVTPAMGKDLVNTLHKFSQARHSDIDCPGIWCQWIPRDDGTALQWDGAEKFYNYEDWLKYLIEHFLKPQGHTVNGDVSWQGEEEDDYGTIIVLDNEVIMNYQNVRNLK